MIGSFVTGIINLVSYIISNYRLLLVLLFLGLIALGIFVFPSSVYLYPFWQSKVEYVEFDLFLDEIPGIASSISVPNWILPDSEKNYVPGLNK